MTAIPYRTVPYRLPMLDVIDVVCDPNCWCASPYAVPHFAARWTPGGETPPWSWLDSGEAPQ